MSEKSRRKPSAEESASNPSPSSHSSQAIEATRHVGPTLEAEGRFIPTGELPENQIANASGARAVNVRDVTWDAYDREAEAMGAERRRTRLPGDTSSDPHTDVAAKSTAGRRKPRRKAA
jgi:hypothetical protein